MNERELRERLAALYAEGAPLAVKSKDGTLTDEEGTRLDAIAAEVADLRPKYEAAQRRGQAAEGLSGGDAEFNRPAGRRASGLVPREDAGGRDDGRRSDAGLSVGQRFVRSEEYRDYVERGMGHGQQSRRFRAGSLYPGHAPTVHAEGMGADELRALITSTTITTLIQPQRLPGIFGPDARPLRTRDVMANLQTTSNLIEFVREASNTNNAAEVAESTSLAGVGVAGGVKPEGGFTLEEDSTPVRTIAEIMYITRQAASDGPAMEGYIDTLLRRHIDEREDRQLLIGDGTAPNLRGVYNTPGVQNLNGPYWAANPLPAEGAAANKWDRLRRAVSKVRITGRAAASAVVMNPVQAEEYDLHKQANGAYLFSGGPAGGVGALRTAWGLPVVEHEDMPNNMALVGDFARYAIVFDRMDTQVYVSDSNRDLFERNILTLLAESRLALAVIRPVAFAKVDLVATA